MPSTKRTVGARVVLDGEKQYKEAISSVNKSMSVLSSEMRKLQAEYKGSEKDHHLVWRHRVRRTVRVHDDTCVADVDQCCKLVLFTLLKKEGVEVLGDLLLTLDREELELLTGA